MSTSSINNLSSYLQSELTALQGTGSTTNATASNLNGIDTSSVGPQQDNGQLSPLAQLLNALQKLQQSDPTKYKEVTAQIATNLQKAAQTAQSDGNTTEANQLNQLATDFTNASTSGQLPNIQDLAQAIGGNHHHHVSGSTASDSDSSATSSSSTGSSSSSASNSASQLKDQLLAALQASGSQNSSLNPLAIILNTLSSSGISTSNS